MTDADRVLLHLRGGHCITPLEAWTQYGIYRLADSVHKLRRRGVEITTEMVHDTDCNGDPCSFARYWLHE